LLERLGLLIAEREGYRLDRECFDSPAPSPDTVQGRWDRHRVQQTDAYDQLLAADPHRAQRALDIVLAGRFDPEDELPHIFDDLRWLGDDEDFASLLALARRRPKNGHQPAWADLWRNHCKRRLERRASRQRMRSAEAVIHFDDRPEGGALLGLVGSTTEDIGELWLFSRLRSRLETRQAARLADSLPQIRLYLDWGASAELLAAALKLGQSNHWRIPLNGLGARAPLHFTLRAYAPESIAGLWLEAWLEAEPRP